MRAVPLATTKSALSFKNTEEFIENLYPVDISHTVEIDCKVNQNGWRTTSLREMLRSRTLLLPNKYRRK